MALIVLLSGCTVPVEPWEPSPESPEAVQAWQKAPKAGPKTNWIFLETQFVEWGPLPPDPPKSSFGADDFNAGAQPRPQQSPLEVEEDPEMAPPAEWSPLTRRQLFIYTQKPVQQGAWSQFQVGWLARTATQWSKRLDLEPPMRVRCAGATAATMEVLDGDRYRPLAINAGLDGSGNGTANLQSLIPELAGWICRKRQAVAREALKPLVVER